LNEDAGTQSSIIAESSLHQDAEQVLTTGEIRADYLPSHESSSTRIAVEAMEGYHGESIDTRIESRSDLVEALGTHGSDDVGGDENAASNQENHPYSSPIESSTGQSQGQNDGAPGSNEVENTIRRGGIYGIVGITNRVDTAPDAARIIMGSSQDICALIVESVIGRLLTAAVPIENESPSTQGGVEILARLLASTRASSRELEEGVADMHLPPTGDEVITQDQLSIPATSTDDFLTSFGLAGLDALENGLVTEAEADQVARVIQLIARENTPLARLVRGLMIDALYNGINSVAFGHALFSNRQIGDTQNGQFAAILDNPCMPQLMADVSTTGPNVAVRPTGPINVRSQAPPVLGEPENVRPQVGSGREEVPAATDEPVSGEQIDVTQQMLRMINGRLPEPVGVIPLWNQRMMNNFRTWHLPRPRPSTSARNLDTVDSTSRGESAFQTALRFGLPSTWSPFIRAVCGQTPSCLQGGHEFFSVLTSHNRVLAWDRNQVMRLSPDARMFANRGNMFLGSMWGNRFLGSVVREDIGSRFVLRGLPEIPARAVSFGNFVTSEFEGLGNGQSRIARSFARDNIIGRATSNVGGFLGQLYRDMRRRVGDEI